MCGCSIHKWHTLSDSSSGLVNRMISLTVAAHPVYTCAANTIRHSLSRTCPNQVCLYMRLRVVPGVGSRRMLLRWVPDYQGATSANSAIMTKQCKYPLPDSLVSSPPVYEIQLHACSLPFPNDNNARNMVHAHTSNSCVTVSDESTLTGLFSISQI